MDVTEIVDQQTEVYGIAKKPRDSTIPIIWIDWLSCSGVQVLRDPGNLPSDIEACILDWFAEVIKEWGIGEVPGRYVIEANVLDVICKSGTLNERVILLVLIDVLHRLQKRFSFFKHLWLTLDKFIIGDTGRQKVTIVPPGMSLRK